MAYQSRWTPIGAPAERMADWSRHPGISAEQWRRRAAIRRAPITDRVRQKILKNANGKCFYCRVELVFIHYSLQQFTIDHVVPIAKGGTHAFDNLVAACRHCNSQKGVR